MQFVALLSGGKDSCYNAIKCVEHGHTLVCLANLLPPADFIGEELNSYMYQSAAFSAIPAMAECFEVPLIRRHIQGGCWEIDVCDGVDGITGISTPQPSHVLTPPPLPPPPPSPQGPYPPFA